MSNATEARFMTTPRSQPGAPAGHPRRALPLRCPRSTTAPARQKFRFAGLIFGVILWFLLSGAANSQGMCSGSDKSKWTNCVAQVTTPKEQKYIGEFRNGKQTGKGAYIYPHGLKYEGDFINGHYNGQGTLTQPDGAKYVGKFLNSKENGEGIEYGADGEVLRSGFWKDGVFVKDMTNLSPPLPKQRTTTPKTEDEVLPADFMAWLSESPNRTHLFSELTNFLIKNGVMHVVPTWQLLIQEADPYPSSEKCPIEIYIIPPRELWNNVVPTLRLIRSNVVPVVGPVRILSGYRSPKFNECNGGSKNSSHMTFSAFDVTPIQFSDVEAVFRKMCERWARIPSLKFGLGTYFDPKNLTKNLTARFHVDTSKVHGRRTWGYDYTNKTSYCNRMLPIMTPAPI